MYLFKIHISRLGFNQHHWFLTDLMDLGFNSFCDQHHLDEDYYNILQ